MAGKSRSYSAVTAAICRAVGKVSLELWERVDVVVGVQ